MANATNNGYTNVRDSAHDYETSGETIDWSYYATRGFAVTLETVGGSSHLRPRQRHQQGLAVAELRNCTTPTTPARPARRRPRTRSPPTAAIRSATRSTRRSSYATLAGGHSVHQRHRSRGRDAEDHQGLHPLHEPVLQQHDAGPSTAPQADPDAPGVLDQVPASGQFTWDVNPSVRPDPPYRAEGMVPGPNGFLQESWTLTCTPPTARCWRPSRSRSTRARPSNLSLCTQGGVGGTVPATLSLTLGAPATFGAFTPGVASDYTASTTATVDLDRGRRDAVGRRPVVDGHRPPGQRRVLAAGAAAGRGRRGGFAKSAARRADVAADLLRAGQQRRRDGRRSSRPIGANDALRTGTYAKTLTFTLSTTTPRRHRGLAANTPSPSTRALSARRRWRGVKPSWKRPRRSLKFRSARPESHGAMRRRVSAGEGGVDGHRRLGVRDDADGEQRELAVQAVERAVADAAAVERAAEVAQLDARPAGAGVRDERRDRLVRARSASTGGRCMPGIGSFGSLWISISSRADIGPTMSASGSSARSGSRIVVVAEDRGLDDHERTAAPPGAADDPAQRRDLVRHRRGPLAPGGEDLLGALAAAHQRAARGAPRPGRARTRSRSRCRSCPPPPRSAQNSSGSGRASVRMWRPSAVTSSIAMTLLHAKPCLRREPAQAAAERVADDADVAAPSRPAARGRRPRRGR